MRAIDSGIALSFLEEGSLAKQALEDVDVCARVECVNIDSKCSLNGIGFLRNFSMLSNLSIQKRLRDYSALDGLHNLCRVALPKGFTQWAVLRNLRLERLGVSSPSERDMEAIRSQSGLRRLSIVHSNLDLLNGRPLSASVSELRVGWSGGARLDVGVHESVSTVRLLRCPELSRTPQANHSLANAACQSE